MKGTAKPRQKLGKGKGGRSSSDKRELGPMGAWKKRTKAMESHFGRLEAKET